MENQTPRKAEAQRRGREFFIEIGRKGGKKTAKRGKKFFSDNGKKGMKSRWKAQV